MIPGGPSLGRQAGRYGIVYGRYLVAAASASAMMVLVVCVTVSGVGGYDGDEVSVHHGQRNGSAVAVEFRCRGQQLLRHDPHIAVLT